MKTIAIIIMLFGLTVQGQIRTDTLPPIRIEFKYTPVAKATKLQVMAINVAAMLILNTKYDWTEKNQKIFTPIILGSVMAFTFTKAIQYNRKKRLFK